MPVPLLETLVDGHPDVEVDFGLGDFVAREELTQTGGVLLQHIAVVLPAAALREHLRQTSTTKTRHSQTPYLQQSGGSPALASPTSPAQPSPAHPRVQVSHVSGFSIFVGDLDVLVAAGVNHHVPGVAVQAVGPVVVALSKIMMIVHMHSLFCVKKKIKREREVSTSAVIL